MDALVINAVGVAAAVCSMSSFAPQMVKIWRERDASSVSLNMYLVTITGFALWTAYGIFIGKWPLVAANTVCLLMSGAVLVMKTRFDAAKGRGAGHS